MADFIKITAGVVLWGAMIMCTPAHAAPTGPKTTIPDGGNYLSKPFFQVSWEDYLATKKGKPCDVIFIGDSITMNWRWGAGREVWKKFYEARAVDFGQSWDTTQNTLWRLKNLDIKGLNPKVAVILIGTNNFKDKPEDVAAGVKAVADTTRTLFGGVKIIFVSILPNGRAKETMEAANKIIRTFADNTSVFYLDLAEKFTPVGDNWKGLDTDRLHPTITGYEMWAAELNPLLAKLIPAFR